jgi:hypothetical protein
VGCAELSDHPALQSLFGAALACLVAVFLLCGGMDAIVSLPPTSIGVVAELLKGLKIWARIQGAAVGGRAVACVPFTRQGLRG